jgi:hypothetical protein
LYLEQRPKKREERKKERERKKKDETMWASVV